MEIDEKQLKDLIIKAGLQIMEVYEDDQLFQQIEKKGDDSPLTLADKRAHDVLYEGLLSAYPDIPVISEEGPQFEYEERKDFEQFWLVDPLDGTKEFINRNNEFTVNIALIVKNYPVLGLIYVPVQKKLYLGSQLGAFLISEEGEEKLSINNSKENRTAVRSRSHPSPEEDSILKKYLVSEEISRGSSLKFCALAEGSADLYYRHGPTMEWDTAAGQAILEAAGGRVFEGNSENKRFKYNKETLLNPGFLCLGF